MYHHFPKENNTRLAPVPFYPHSPLHILKVTDIFLEINRGNTKINTLSVILCDEKKKK